MSYFVNLRNFWVGTEYSSNDIWNGCGEAHYLDGNEFEEITAALDYAPRAYGRSIDEWEIVEWDEATGWWSLVCNCKRIKKGELKFRFQPSLDAGVGYNL